MATAANGLMPGVFQAAGDTHRGVLDRFRTLPVGRAAVPLGQAAADLIVTAVGTVPFLLVGLGAGWRIEGSASEAVGTVGAYPGAGSSAWCAVLVTVFAVFAVFAPLAVRRYARGE